MAFKLAQSFALMIVAGLLLIACSERTLPGAYPPASAMLGGGMIIVGVAGVIVSALFHIWL